MTALLKRTAKLGPDAVQQFKAHKALERAWLKAAVLAALGISVPI